MNRRGWLEEVTDRRQRREEWREEMRRRKESYKIQLNEILVKDN